MSGRHSWSDDELELLADTAAEEWWNSLTDIQRHSMDSEVFIGYAAGFKRGYRLAERGGE